VSLWRRLTNRKRDGIDRPEPAPVSGHASAPEQGSGAVPLGTPPPPDDADPAPSVLVWKARPIFLSSTFRDMHSERDHLRDHAFLGLGEQLRERAHFLDTIDLRQGVETAAEADEAKREMQVLQVCLAEIERSKPFLVGLLGDRYGWIPPAERIAAAAREAGLPPSVEVAGKSVTELEILFGVLENPDQARRSWFYFRTVDRAGMPPEVAARFPAEEPSDDPTSPAGRLRALKERIRRELPDRVRDYDLRWSVEGKFVVGLDELDHMVARDLWTDLSAATEAYLREAPRTQREADARAVEDFVAERTRGYVERPAVTDAMLAHALSPAATGGDWGLVVTSESGGGKSSLFGRVFLDLKLRDAAGELILLAHAAGIYPMSGQVDRMLRNWVAVLAERLGVADPLDRSARPTRLWSFGARDAEEAPVVTSEEIESAFADLLRRVSARTRVVLLVDALNQFEPTVRASYVTWLPKVWPDNARLLATAIPGPASAALGDREGCRELPVPVVSRAEAEEIARRFQRERYHRGVNPRVLDGLLARRQPGGQPAHGNPLWLSLALQEMNLLEADDYERADKEYAQLDGAARMEALQLAEAAKLPADIPGIYGELLARAERGFGAAWTGAFVSLTALGRAGWRESDLRALMPRAAGQPWDEVAFAGVRRALGTHVVQRGAQAQWDFFHAALRDTVQYRALAEASRRQGLHGMIVDHLQSLPPSDPLRLGELMVHLLGLGDSDRAADNLAAMQAGQWTDSNAQAALASATSVLSESLQAAPDEAEWDRLVHWIADLLGGNDDDRAGRLANVFVFDLNDALMVTGVQKAEVSRARLLQASQSTLQRLAAADPSNAGWQRDLSVSQAMIGDVLRARGDLGGALKAFRESLALRQRLAAADPSYTGWQRDLCMNYVKLADLTEKTGSGDAKLWWRKAYDTLSGVKSRGIMLPTDEQYLAALRSMAER